MLHTVDLLLPSLRHVARRLAAAVIVLYAATGLLAMASVCIPGPHRHQGTLAPDCVMHHQAGTHHGAGSGGHHGSPDASAHHAAAPAAPESVMTCACGAELQAMHPADAVVLVPATPWSPAATVTSAEPNSQPRLPSVDLQSSSPPPRA